MKISNFNITVIISVLVSVLILGLQKPITDSILKKQLTEEDKYHATYSIKNAYILPEILNEISGITSLGNGRFACIQDEDGVIFIYNINDNEIEYKVKFGKPGDYEAIAINESDAYVMHSEGVIFEIKDYESENPEISEIETPFKVKNNIESLTFDPDNNRLLTIAKNIDLDDKSFKNIYEIPLDTKIMNLEPIAKINLNDIKFKSYKQKSIEKTFNPSDIAIHPKTKDIYIIEGKNPKLLILTKNGELSKVLPLDKKKFEQPEGITFSEDNRLFISNEANSSNANILEVIIKE